MLRSFAHVTALLAALAATAPALAQEKGAPAQERARIGLGISLTAFDVAALAAPVPTTSDVSVILDLGQFRVEPSLGISTYSVDAGPKGREFALGCGLLFPIKPGRTVSVYVGPRLFLGLASATERAGAASFSDSGLDLTLAGVFGAEWFADPRFSIGAEARLSYLMLPELSDAGRILRPSSSLFGTSGHVYFRFYL